MASEEMKKKVGVALYAAAVAAKIRPGIPWDALDQESRDYLLTAAGHLIDANPSITWHRITPPTDLL